jgi:hypothetical protein
MMKNIRDTFAKHKYLLQTCALFIALLVTIGFRSGNIGSYFSNLLHVLLEAGVLCFTLFLFQMFASWLLFPFFPQKENFKDDESHDNYFEYSTELTNFVFPLIYVVVAVVLALDIKG